MSKPYITRVLKDTPKSPETITEETLFYSRSTLSKIIDNLSSIKKGLSTIQPGRSSSDTTLKIVKALYRVYLEKTVPLFPAHKFETTTARVHSRITDVLNGVSFNVPQVFALACNAIDAIVSLQNELIDDLAKNKHLINE